MSDPLLDAASAISKASPKIRDYALLQAATTISDEKAITALRVDLKKSVTDLSQVDIIQNSTLDEFQKSVGDLSLISTAQDQEIKDLTARVVALEGLVVAPPAPVSTRVGNGFILFREGTSWTGGDPSLYASRYGVVVVGYGNDLDAAKLSPARGCAYRTCVEVPNVSNVSNSFGGVNYNQAVSLGALMQGDIGLLHPSTGVYAGDMGIPAYQDAWCANVKARLQSQGLKTLFLDNVVKDCWFGTPKLAGGLSFADAYVSLLQAIQRNLPDIYVIANCGPSGPDWATRIAPYVGGLVNENPVSGSGLQSWMGAVQTAGRDPYVLVSGDPASASVRSWAQVFAVNWDRKGGGFGVDFGSPDPWNPNWTSVIA